MIGILAGSGAVSVVTTFLPEQSTNAWGWRVPFLFGGLLGIFSLLMVRRLHEIHIKKRDEKHAARSPLREALTRDIGRSIKAVLFVSGYGVIFYIPLVYLPTYMHKYTGMALDAAMRINTLGTIVLVFFIPLAAVASDRIVRRKTILAGGFLLFAALSYPLFMLLQHNRALFAIIVQLVFGVLIAIPLGTAPAMLVELFPTDDRLTGYSLAYNIGAGVVGGTTPLMATWLISTTGNAFAPCFYLIGWAAICFVALGLMRDRSREPLM
jgi:MHS family proline/betaine transporter-like MFS transporter